MDTDDELLSVLEDSNGIEASTPKPSAKKRKKPQVTSSWTSESTNDLIQAVETHSCIWEYSCLEHKDRQKRDKA